MMKRWIIGGLIAMVMGTANAVLLVHEDFEGMAMGGNPGSASEFGVGISGWGNSLGSYGDSWVTNSLVFGSYAVGSNALYITKNSTGGALSFDTATTGISTGAMYISMLFKGTSSDLAAASFFQVRNSDNNFRVSPLAAGTADTGIGVAYGGTTYYEDNGNTLMNNDLYMVIAKFDGLGAAGGTSTIWAIDDETFNAIVSGGISEAELSANAYLHASGVDTETLVLNSTVTFNLFAGGEAQYRIDEIKIGTSLEDVVGVELTGGFLLVHEDFEDMVIGDNPGTVSSSACGAGIVDWGNSLGSNGDAWITNSLVFNTYLTGNNALYVTDYSGGSLTFTTLTEGVTNGPMFVSMVFSGTANDLTAASFMQMRRITGSLDFRVCPLASGTSDFGLGVAYASSAYKEDNSDTLMNNGTYMVIAKFDGLGSTAGNASVWAIDTNIFYNIKSGGITEAELDAHAYLRASGTDSTFLTLGENDQFMLAFGGEAQYTIDEIKIGTSLESVTVPLTTTGPVFSSIVSLDSVSNVVRMIFYASSPSDTYPLVSTNLTTGKWETVAHSDDGVNAFIITNLSYSSLSGSNRVIFLQADAETKFFGIGGE
ncbi:hypothetical protein [Tichowtungia aerotolerans]|uniref:Uncharacterized protein n=1 Tax=Tichowtungia aerotolerans TaxID=2697043 RepID=A0A6P1M6F5_9BACT|nr:hypothetical protein [Tichowtungia aerotolerans]QHI70160.1 hypothetical protein GT409_12125 [Tichowtungia aerotolerans]